MTDTRIWRHLDFVLLVGLVLLIIAGVAMIYSASRGDPQLSLAPTDQAITALIGLVLILIISIFDYTLFKNVTAGLYVAVILSLVLVLLVGTERNGARRWFTFASFDVQPAELAKLLLGIVLAKFVADRQGKRLSLIHI